MPSIRRTDKPLAAPLLALEKVMELTEKDIARFWSKVDRRGPDECWPWSGNKTSRGYGRLWLGGRPVYAHRLAVVISGREMPHARLACHSCDTPLCVNPSHLFVGTWNDNVQDAKAKGRLRGPHRDKTHCKHGHPLSGENVGKGRPGNRVCLACKREQSRRAYASKVDGPVRKWKRKDGGGWELKDYPTNGDGR